LNRKLVTTSAFCTFPHCTSVYKAVAKLLGRKRIIVDREKIRTMHALQKILQRALNVCLRRDD